MQIEEFLKAKCSSELNRLGAQYPKKRSVVIDFKDLEAEYSEMADQLLTNPSDTLEQFETAIAGAGVAFSQKTEGEMQRINARFINLPLEATVRVKDCNSAYLSRFTTVHGIVTKAVDVLPKVWRSVFKCKRCGKETEMIQRKLAMSEPPFCESCNRREFELVLNRSHFIDYQKIEIQEPLEMLKGGEQAQRISVWLENDLTGMVVPGQKIMINGTLKLQPPKGNMTVYQKFIDANNVQFTEQEFEELELSDEEIEEIKNMAKDPKLYDKIISSIAPSIYGHSEAKEAIMLQLFSGSPNKVLPDGMRIRSNIHVLLIGDPGTAKSQMLKYVNRLAPKSLYVSGKSSSGAGLTASAEKDEFGEGGWVLKAGALVIASGGLAAIDEFDKMTLEDRSAIHEALEQQTVSVAKAGIIATFKAESSVLAAANPKYSRFDPYKPPADQFDIPPTILSRFDLIFPIKDVLDEQRDKALASHILMAHRFSHVKDKTGLTEEAKKALEPQISGELLRRYIAYARKSVIPILTDESIARLQDYYVELRKKGADGTVPLTPRQLEALVRLSEASAKVRISNKVELQDAERAIRLVEFVLGAVGMDEKGGFDIDRIMADHPKSEREKIYSIIQIVKNLEGEYDQVPREKVVEQAREYYSIDKSTADKLIHELINKGDLYEPRYGVLKTVSK